MIRSITVLSIMLFAVTMYAQSSMTIEGKIVEESSGDPVPFATVTLLTKDSSLVSGTITDGSGDFRLKVEKGYFNLQVQFVAMETRVISIEPTTGTLLNLGKIGLFEASTQLEELVIQGERTQMELNLDKKVYNVGKDLSNLGGSASDILDNLPSVTVDVEGNVELRGSSNVQVLIDGKPSGLIGLSSTDALRQLQGNMVETVEIITNPSARYDAEGMSGIINIILKKEKKKGINGSLQLNTGVPHNHGVSLNANFRRDWINFFVNYGVNFRQNPGGGSGFQKFAFPDTSYTTNLERNSDRGGLSNNLRFGADFFLGENTTVTTSFLYRFSDEENRTDLTFEDFDSNNELLNYTLREDREEEGDENLEYTVNLSRKFQRKGQKLTADIQFQNNFETENSNIIQLEGPNDQEAIPLIFQKVGNEEGERRLMLQSDYIHPFGAKGILEIGYRSTLRNIRNIYGVEEQDEVGVYVALDTFSTNFAYDEDVHAGYFIVSNEIGKFSWQTGIRVENTSIAAELRESDTQLNWNYTNFFPSFFTTYSLPSENQLQLSYSRRINRPRFRELNPFSSFSDNRNFRVGNPNIQPEFTDSYEFGYLQNLAKATLYYGVYYRYTTDLIQRVTLEPNELGQRISIPENIGTAEAIGLELNASNEFADWYRISGNFNFFHRETRGSIGDSISLAAKAVTFTTRMSNNFKIKDVLDGQINLNYRAPENRPQGRRLSITSLDLGISKDILSGNGTFSISVRDVFNSRKFRSETVLPNFYEQSTWQWRKGPQAIVTFTYRLNQKKRTERRGGGRGEYQGDEGGFS
jgi:outer membrane receptor protein involved in Fe transport